MIKKQNIAKLIEKVFLLLMSIQVILGCVWICQNMGHVPQFEESACLLQASKDWILDEYIGILYPLVIHFFSVIGNVFGLNFCIFLYIFQLGAAFFAGFYFLKKVIFSKRKVRMGILCLTAAYAVTFPPILQCHMSVLPYSAASSVMLCLLTEIKLWREGTDRLFAQGLLKICLCCFVSALLLPDYIFLSGLTAVAAFVLYGRKQPKRILVLVLAACMTILCTGTALTLTQKPGSLGRIQKSVGAVMVSRFVWPYFERNAFLWRDEVNDLFDHGKLDEIACYPERVIYDFGPGMEEIFGKEEANDIYWEMAIDSLFLRTKESIGELGRDLVANLTTPLSLQWQLKGKGVSYTGWNYERMKEKTPALTDYYVIYAAYSFDFMLLVSAALYLSAGRKAYKKSGGGFGLIVLLSAVATGLWYTMAGNGIQDYIKVVPISILWCLFLTYGLRKGMDLDDSDKEGLIR